MMEFAMKTGNIGMGNNRTLATLNKMGVEVIPGLIESIHKVTSVQKGYGKKAAGARMQE